MRAPEILQATLSFQRDQFYREVGARIRGVRESKRLTQESVAASIGFSRTSLTNIEKGRQKLLLHTLTEIASALSVSANDLLPSTVDRFENIQIKLPTSLPDKQKDFVQRALSSVIQNEKTPDKQNSRISKPVASRTRNHQRAGKR
jgi:transcriptional regulator with XRE-family HTH domain